jgi:hypothetical protein
MPLTPQQSEARTEEWQRVRDRRAGGADRPDTTDAARRRTAGRAPDERCLLRRPDHSLQGPALPLARRWPFSAAKPGSAALNLSHSGEPMPDPTNDPRAPGRCLSPRVAIAMRSYNDIDVIRGTLENVRRQRYRNFELWNFDSSSSDGTIDVIREYNAPERIQQNDSKAYNPGRVLNPRRARSGRRCDRVFSTPTRRRRVTTGWSASSRRWRMPKVGATFGRQTRDRTAARCSARTPSGPSAMAASRPAGCTFFSMANSAARREVLEQYPFETQVQYSEDIEWSYRLRKAGPAIRLRARRRRPPTPTTTRSRPVLQAPVRRGQGGGLDLPRRRGQYLVPALHGAARSAWRCCATGLGGARALAGRRAAQRAAAPDAEVGPLAGCGKGNVTMAKAEPIATGERIATPPPALHAGRRCAAEARIAATRR